MGNLETTTKVSRLKSTEDNYSFTLGKENYHLLLRRKCSLKMDLKKSEFLKGFFNLFVFGFLFIIIQRKTMIFYCEENIH